MDHNDELDLRLRTLFGSVRLRDRPSDRRSDVAAAVRRRGRRRKLGSLAAAGMLVGVGLAAAAAVRAGTERVNVGPRAGSTERVIEVPGLPDAIRVSQGLGPVAGAEPFGAVPLAGGAVTGATQTRVAADEAVVLIAITPGPTTDSVEVSGEGAESLQVFTDEPSLLVVRLQTWSPHQVLTLSALGPEGELHERTRITPFVQHPLDCATSTELVGSRAPAGPTRVPHLDAYLAAPLLPSCDR